MKKFCIPLSTLFILLLWGCTTAPSAPDSDTSDDAAPAADSTLPTEPLSPPPVHYELDGSGFYRLLMSELALLNEEPEVALMLLGEAHEQYPRDRYILQRVAPLAAQMGNLPLSLRYFSHWTEVSPHDTDAWHGVWQLALADIDPDLAIDALQALLDLNPGYEFYTPFERLTEWEYPDLDRLYSAVTQSDLGQSDNPDVLLLLGFLAELQDDMTRAESYWHSLADQMQSRRDYYAYGEILTDLNASNGARIVLNAGTEVYPDEPRFYLQLARTWLQVDDQVTALEVLQAGLEHSPEAPALLRFAGELAFDQGRPEAEDLFTRLLDTPEYSAGHYYLGRLAQEDNEPERAFEHYHAISDTEWALGAMQQMIELLHASALPEVSARDLFAEQRDRFPDLIVEMTEVQGRYWYDIGNYEDAFHTFSLGLRVAPNDFYLLYMRALSAEPLDRLDDLEADLRLILDQDPDNTAALNALGYTLVDRTDRVDEAAPMIEQAYQQNPDSYAIKDSLGWLRFHQSRYDEAVEILAEALEMQGWENEDDEIVSHYIEALWASGQQDKAKDIARQWLERHGFTERLQELANRLELNIP
ncbi:tetratricopeptide repeat protein [Natronospirillum operosum]|uniref:Tetratricopeptide repeat protein n=1 Tax=Natronospirillum operosum TaxID=2759953 RepID=A0A4Z0WL18_9GAMM|nr:tetratricopeptide repeat protein [Natronospirillum operosum]TGG95925.1 tetratricopeptide repeat protein [Natronospirillum operosum]